MDLKELGKKLHCNYLSILKKKKKAPSCFVGFDGFTDKIIFVVDKIKSPHSKTFIPTIKKFGLKILKASTTSTNFELVSTKTKIGGNGPIFTNALLEGAHAITFTGAIGLPNKIEPLFIDMAKRCQKVYSLAPSAKTEALEFQDGKIILGQLSSLQKITYQNILKAIGKDNFIKLLAKTDLLVSTNWTMVEETTHIWEGLLKDVAPKLSKSKKPKYLFVDLADPSKRSQKDILKALKVLTKLNHYYKVILALNLREAEIICKALKLTFPKTILSKITLKKIASQLFLKLKLSRILIHHAKFAISHTEKETFFIKSFYNKNPKLQTGAGDNFNAGYCNALLYGFKEEECLVIASLTAAFYVTHGKSPTMNELKNYVSKRKIN